CSVRRTIGWYGSACDCGYLKESKNFQTGEEPAPGGPERKELGPLGGRPGGPFSDAAGGGGGGRGGGAPLERSCPPTGTAGEPAELPWPDTAVRLRPGMLQCLSVIYKQAKNRQTTSP